MSGVSGLSVYVTFTALRVPIRDKGPPPPVARQSLATAAPADTPGSPCALEKLDVKGNPHIKRLRCCCRAEFTGTPTRTDAPHPTPPFVFQVLAFPKVLQESTGFFPDSAALAQKAEGVDAGNGFSFLPGEMPQEINYKCSVTPLKEGEGGNSGPRSIILPPRRVGLHWPMRAWALGSKFQPCDLGLVI